VRLEDFTEHMTTNQNYQLQRDELDISGQVHCHYIPVPVLVSVLKWKKTIA